MNKPAASISVITLIISLIGFLLQPSPWSCAVVLFSYCLFAYFMSDPKVSETQEKLALYEKKLDEFANVMNLQAKAIETLKAAISMRNTVR